MNIREKLRSWAALQTGSMSTAFSDTNTSNISELFDWIANHIDVENKHIINIPLDSMGNHWMPNDVCITDNGKKGTVSGYDEEGMINVYIDGEDKFEWFFSSEIHRPYLSIVLSEIEDALNKEDYDASDLQRWQSLLSKVKEA